jgi:hypothetical protein
MYYVVGTDFLGSMSVNLDAVCKRAEPVKTLSGETIEMSMKRPRWFWLHNKNDGLQYEASIVQQIAPVSRDVALLAAQPLPHNLCVEGRGGFESNDMVSSNAIYIKHSIVLPVTSCLSCYNSFSYVLTLTLMLYAS